MCSITHGAILLDCSELLPRGAATAGCRDDATAPTITRKAVKRSSEETIRRHRDGVNLEVAGGFLIIGLPVFEFEWGWERKLEPAFSVNRSALSNLFARSLPSQATRVFLTTVFMHGALRTQ